MPVTKRITTTYDITYDHDLKIQVDYADLRDIVKSGLDVLEPDDAGEITRGHATFEYLPFAELQRLAAKQGLFLSTSNKDVHGEVKNMMSKPAGMNDPDLKACMAYVFLDRKIDAIKHLRTATGFGLKEAKDAVELVAEIGLKISLFEIIKAVAMETERRCERLDAGTFDQVIESNRLVPGYKS